MWYALYLGNFAVAIAAIWPALPGLTPLWSLQVEEQFYLVLPVLVRRLRATALRRALWSAVLISPALRLLLTLVAPDNLYAAYVLLPCHMGGLALGGLIALRLRSGPWRIDERRLTLFVVGSLALTCALSRWSNPTRIAEELTTPFNRTIGYSLSSVACAGLVLWLVRFRGSAATAWLRVPPMRYLGRISYGVYLLHIPARETIYFLGHRIGC